MTRTPCMRENSKKFWGESHGEVKVWELFTENSGLEQVFYAEDQSILFENFSYAAEWFFEERSHQLEFYKHRKDQQPDHIWIKPYLDEDSTYADWMKKMIYDVFAAQDQDG